MGAVAPGHFYRTIGVYSRVRLLLVEHACARAAADVHQQLARGTALLATISTTAPWLGILLTCYWIVNSFKGCGCEKSAMLRAISGSLSESLYLTAYGLATATFAWWLREHFRSVIAELDTEMRAATLTLLNELRRTAR